MLVAGFTLARYYLLSELALTILVIIAVLFSLSLIYLLISWRFKVAKIVLAILVLLIAVLYFNLLEYSWQQDQLASAIGVKTDLSGRVVEVEKRDYGFRYRLDSLKINNKEEVFKSQHEVILTVFSQENNLAYGDLISSAVRLELADQKRNPGGFSYRDYLKQEGVYALASLSSHDQLLIIDNQANYLKKLALNLQQSLFNKVNTNFSKPYNYLIKALVLGDNSNLPAEIGEEINQTGLSHLFVVSGFHVGLVATIIYFLAGKLKLSFLATLCLSSSAIFSYLLITGFEVPGLRAFMLFLFLAVAKGLKREINIYNLLAIIAILILLANPYKLFTVSFQLSFGAVVAIATITPIIKDLLPNKLAKVNNLISASLAAQLGLVPILAYHFYEISLISVLANLFVAPLISLTLLLAILFLFISFISSVATTGLVYIIELLLKLILGIVELISQNFWTTVLIGRPNLLEMILYYLSLYYLIKLCKKEIIPYSKRIKKKLVILSLAIGLLLLSAFSVNNRLKVIFFDVGQGDAIYLELPQGVNFLIDTGVSGQEIKNYLKSRGKKRIDYLLISHFHYDHAGGVIKLADNFKVGKIIYPPRSEVNDLKGDITAYIERQGIKSRRFSKYDRLKGDNFSLKSLAPFKEELSRRYKNNNSLVLKFSYGNLDILLTGDIEKETEQKLLTKGFDLSANLLKVAHHGSDSSSMKELLAEVNPQKSIIQVGANSYGHPSTEVINRLEAVGSKVLRNDQHGAIIFTSDGDSISYELFVD